MDRTSNTDDTQSLLLAMGAVPIDPKPPYTLIRISEALVTIEKTPEYARLLERRRRGEMTSAECMRRIVDLCVAHIERGR